MNRHCLKLIPALLLLVASTARADRVDRFVKERMDKQHIPGLSLVVIRDGKVVKSKGYGLADVERSVPAGPDTVYELGSITKQFTATAVMMLVEAGNIGLDEKISTYLTDLPDAWKEITVRQLLTHTSGIKGYTEVPGFAKITVNDASPEEVIHTVAGYPLQFSPGEKWAYSNTGYFLLGLIIEKVSGKRYAAFLKERIFAPLGMNATRVNDPHDVIPNRACGYSWHGGTLHNADWISMTWPYAAGVLVSTVNDMAKWDAALYTEKLLKRSSLDQMWTPAKLKDGKSTDYGFGWFVQTVAGHRQIGHGGGIPGFSTHIARFPDDRLTVIALTNEEGSQPDRITRGVAGLYIPALAPPVEKPMTDTEPTVTARVRDLILKLAEGKPEAEQFTPALRAELFPNRVKEAGQMFKSFGPLQSVTLMARREEGENRTYRYRIAFRDTTLLCMLTLDKEDKIAGLGFMPE